VNMTVYGMTKSVSVNSANMNKTMCMALSEILNISIKVPCTVRVVNATIVRFCFNSLINQDINCCAQQLGVGQVNKCGKDLN